MFLRGVSRSILNFRSPLIPASILVFLPHKMISNSLMKIASGSSSHKGMINFIFFAFILFLRDVFNYSLVWNMCGILWLIQKSERTPLGNFSCFCCLCPIYQNQLIRKFVSGVPSECQIDWIQIRPNILCQNCLQKLSADENCRQRVKITHCICIEFLAFQPHPLPPSLMHGSRGGIGDRGWIPA